MSDPKSPSHLGRSGRALWRAVVADYDLEPHQLAMLEGACMARDRAMAAAEIIAADGVVTVDRYGSPKAHPAVGIERDARLGMSRLLRELALEVDGPVERARPPRIRAVQ